MIPQTFEEWIHCITVDCGITLNTKYVQQRIADLENLKDPSTLRFIELYGALHHQQVIGWFQSILDYPQL